MELSKSLQGGGYFCTYHVVDEVRGMIVWIVCEEYVYRAVAGHQVKVLSELKLQGLTESSEGSLVHVVMAASMSSTTSLTALASLTSFTSLIKRLKRRQGATSSSRVNVDELIVGNFLMVVNLENSSELWYAH
jgi:hypothetical protein